MDKQTENVHLSTRAVPIQKPRPIVGHAFFKGLRKILPGARPPKYYARVSYVYKSPDIFSVAFFSFQLFFHLTNRKEKVGMTVNLI